MAYGFNANTYIVKKRVQWRDIFNQESLWLDKNDEVGSGIANQLIVSEDTDDVAEGQEYIDKMIELGYIELSQGLYWDLIALNYLRVVNGDVDNGVDYGNWSSENPNIFEIVSNKDSLEIIGASERTGIQVKYEGFEQNLIASESYLFVFDVTKNDLDASDYWRTTGAQSFEGNIRLFYGQQTGETRIVLDTLSLVGLARFALISNSLSLTGSLKFSLSVYLASQFTNPLTDPLPISQQPVDGNSFIMNDDYDDIIGVDTQEILYDLTDPNNPITKLKPWGDYFEGNQLDVSVITTKCNFYFTEQ